MATAGIFYLIISRFWREGLHGHGFARIIAGTFGVAGAFVMLVVGLAILYQTVTSSSLHNDPKIYLALVALMIICFSGIFYALRTRFWWYLH